MAKTAYQAWMDKVDAAVWWLAGCSIHDLSDQPTRLWYEEGVSPKQAAKDAIKRDREG